MHKHILIIFKDILNRLSDLVKRGHGLGHITKIPVMPIYGQTFKNLRNQKSYDFEAWQGLLCTQVLTFIDMITLG